MPWLLPSRRRLHNLRRFFEAAEKAKTTTPGYVIVSYEDYRDNKAEYNSLNLLPGWTVVDQDADMQGDKIRHTRHLWGDADWVALIGDDQVPMTECWDQLLVSEIKGWNMLSCNDNWTMLKRNGRIGGPQVYSGELIREVGYIFPDGIQHQCLDDVWEILGRMTGCWQIRQDVLVEHNHYQNGRAPHDDTYQRAYHRGEDKTRFEEWTRGEHEQSAEKIRTLMRRHGVEPHQHEVPIFVGPNQTVPQFNGQP